MNVGEYIRSNIKDLTTQICINTCFQHTVLLTLDMFTYIKSHTLYKTKNRINLKNTNLFFHILKGFFFKVMPLSDQETAYRANL